MIYVKTEQNMVVFKMLLALCAMKFPLQVKLNWSTKYFDAKKNCEKTL